MNSGRVGLFLGVVFSIVLVATVFSTLTSVGLQLPVTGDNISGVYTVRGFIPVGESASVVNFYWFDGNEWFLIGSNVSGGVNFTYIWDTSTIDESPAQVKVNATNGSVGVTSTSAESLTIDNTMPVITNINNASITQISASITWTTDEHTNSSVKYGTTTDLLTGTSNKSGHVLSHSIPLTNLTENQLYYYNVTSCDYSGNCKTEGPTSFTTLTAYPQISSISVSKTNSSGYVTWNTNELTNSSIEWGLTTALGGGSSGNVSNATSHGFNITSLLNGTQYYYNVTSCDLVNQCNTTGPNSFTTLVDSTEPVFTGGISFNGDPVASVSEGDYMNITFSVGDNIGVSSAWVVIDLQNGTTFNSSVVNVSGLGTLDDNYLFSLYYECDTSGIHNVSAHAVDGSGNYVNTSISSWTVLGYFTVNANISSPFSNFTNGENASILLTVINDRNTSDNYSIYYNITNGTTDNLNHTRGWVVGASPLVLNNIPAGGNDNFNVQVSVPSNASETIYVNVRINSSSGGTVIKSYTLQQARIIIDLPEMQRVSNDTEYTGILYYFYNYTNVSWMKTINTSINFTGEISENITDSDFDCGLWNRTTLEKTGVIDLVNSTIVGNKLINVTCSINITSSEKAGKYNLTINITDDQLKRNSTQTEIIIPGAITIDAGNGNAIKGSGIVFSGSAKYTEDTDLKVINGTVTVTYSDKICKSKTTASGTFSVNCPSLDTAGNYQISIKVDGMFNTTATKTVTLTVKEPVEEGEEDPLKLEIVPSDSIIDLTEIKNTSISIFNNLLVSTDVSINLTESGSKKHFDFNYEETEKTIAVGESADFYINIEPFKYGKPGTYDLVVTAGNYSEIVKIKIPGFNYVNDSVNTNRYIEKEGNKSIVSIEVANKKNAGVEMEVTETIPKEVASNVNEVTFDIKPVVIESDPIVMWSLNLTAGSTNILSYSVDKDVGNDVSFTVPQSVITSISESGEDEVVSEDTISNTRRIIYVSLIFVLAAVGVVLILFKDQLFEKKDTNYLKPSKIKEAKKKLVGKVDVVKKAVIEKKKEKKLDFSKEPVFEFSGVKKDAFKKKKKEL